MLRKQDLFIIYQSNRHMTSKLFCYKNQEIITKKFKFVFSNSRSYFVLISLFLGLDFICDFTQSENETIEVTDLFLTFQYFSKIYK